MILFDPANTSIPKISQERSKKIVKDFLLKRDELWFIDVDNTIDVSEIQDYTLSVSQDFDSVVILGVWGSALGTKALLEALYWKYYNENKKKTGKNIYVLDNIDPETFGDVEEIIDIKRTLFVFISKSGGTIETLSEYLYFREKCKKQSSDWKKHFCFIVWKSCEMRDKLEEDFKTFYIPENIWGRFSVFTAVGLIPLSFSWIDVSLFMRGIHESKEKLLTPELSENIALQLAFTQYKYYREGKNITVFFPYSSRMFQVWEWYKQLMWESTWKNKEGITLTSSLWATDQHSQVQLYQDGPADKLFLTLGVQDETCDQKIDESIPGFTFKKLLEIEKYWTETSLKNEWHPLCSLTVNKLDPQNIAELLYTLMFQVAYLWELFEINAFDQPWVEKSKIITKKKLQEEFWDMDIFSKAFYE